MFCRFSLLPLFVLSLPIFCSAFKNDKVPVGLRPAKEQHEEATDQIGGRTEEGGKRPIGNMPITPTTSVAIVRTNENNSKPLIFHRNFRNGKGNGGPLGVAFVINGTETVPTKVRTTMPPPVGKDFGVNTILQTNLVDSQGHVLRGVSSVQLPASERNRRQKSKGSKMGSRASASQVQVEAEANPIRFSGQRAKEK